MTYPTGDDAAPIYLPFSLEPDGPGTKALRKPSTDEAATARGRAIYHVFLSGEPEPLVLLCGSDGNRNSYAKG